MTIIIVTIIGVVLSAIAISIVYRMRIGHLIGVHVFKFENAYDIAFNERASGKAALREALLVFGTCPKFKELRENDLKRIVDIIGNVPDPKYVIMKIIMDLDSAKALAALKDEILLRDIAEVYAKESNNRTT